MRSFIGLDLAPREKLSLDQWRQNVLPEIMSRKKSLPENSGMQAFPYAVPAANYHITLAFLGDINPRQHEVIVDELSQIQLPPFTLTLDTTGVWDGPKVLFAAPTTPPNELKALARSVRKAARVAKISLQKQDYCPHVTLVRKATSALPPPLLSPELTLSFTRFHLFESMSGNGGVHYPIRASWELRPNLSTREQLRQGLL